MMTYNWDNMVEITVPKGTNGWVYSGEVTINGVKVRFPVGTPTTVPEPAAALLNKMIELEREDDLSGAKPNNHYVGNVTVPDGKTLTLQKGAKVVDEAGVLGGGNAGGGGSSAPAEVVILPETTMEVDPEAGNAYITTPLSATPSDGATAKIIYNGVEYTSPITYLAQESMSGYAIGNLEVVGMSGGNPDAPFAAVLVPDGQEGMYGLMMPLDGSTTVTISITQTASSSGNDGGGLFIINGRNTEHVNQGLSAPLTVDKAFSQILAAYNGKKQIVLRVTDETSNNIVCELQLGLYIPDSAFLFAGFWSVSSGGFPSFQSASIKSDGTADFGKGQITS